MRAAMALMATLIASAAPAQDDRALEHWLHVCERPQLDYWIQLCARVQARDPSMNRRPAQPDGSGAGEVQVDSTPHDGREAAPRESHP
jgi:hypothetical protein